MGGEEVYACVVAGWWWGVGITFSMAGCTCTCTRTAAHSRLHAATSHPPPRPTPHLGERVARGLHEGGVEGAADGHRHRLERALGGGLALHLLQRILVACGVRGGAGARGSGGGGSWVGRLGDIGASHLPTAHTTHTTCHTCMHARMHSPPPHGPSPPPPGPSPDTTRPCGNKKLASWQTASGRAARTAAHTPSRSASPSPTTDSMPCGLPCLAAADMLSARTLTTWGRRRGRGRGGGWAGACGGGSRGKQRNGRESGRGCDTDTPHTPTPAGHAPQRTHTHRHPGWRPP